MGLQLGSQWMEFIFDGKGVYSTIFPDQLVQAIQLDCGIGATQEMLAQTCQLKMEDRQVVCNAMTGEWMTEAKGTPFTCSVGSETYWNS